MGPEGLDGRLFKVDSDRVASVAKRISIASAFWGSGALSDQIDAFLRIILVDNSVTLLTCNASRAGFERTAPDLSRRLLAIGAAAYREAGGAHFDSAVRACFDAVTAAIDKTPAQSLESNDAWLLVAKVEQSGVEVAWLGPDELRVVNAAADVWSTRGHVDHISAESTQGEFWSRGVGPEHLDRTPELARFGPLTPRDRVIVASRSVIRRSSATDFTSVASAQPIQTAADALVKVGQRTGQEAVAYVAILELPSDGD